MKYIKYVMEAVAVLFGLLVGFFVIKNKEDKQLLDDNKNVVAGLAVQTQQIASNDQDIAKQEVIQNQLKVDMEKTKNDTTQENPSNVVDFFNNRK